MSPSELKRRLLDQRLHIAIGVFYEHKAGLTYHHICNEKLTLYCGHSHPLYNVKDLSLEDIEEYIYIERTYSETLAGANIPFKPTVSAYTSSLEATLLLILSGEFIGFLPAYYSSQSNFKGKIKAILKVSALVHTHSINRAVTDTSLDILFQQQMTLNKNIN